MERETSQFEKNIVSFAKEMHELENKLDSESITRSCELRRLIIIEAGKLKLDYLPTTNVVYIDEFR